MSRKKHPQVRDYPEWFQHALERQGYKPDERVDPDNAFVQICIGDGIPGHVARNLLKTLDVARATRPKL